MPFPTFVEKLGSSSFLGVAKEPTYGQVASGIINSSAGAATTFTNVTNGTMTDPSQQFVTNTLIGRSISAGGKTGTISANTINGAGSLITINGTWSGGVPAAGSSYTITGANNYTVNSYLPVTGATLEPDPGLFSPAVMMAQRDKNIFALYGQYKFSGAVDAPVFATNGMQFLAGSVGVDVCQYGIAPATSCMGYITASQNAGSVSFTINLAGAAASNVFTSTGTFQTLAVGALGQGQYGHNMSGYVSTTNTSYTGTSATDPNAQWTPNQWNGRIVTQGNNAATITGNTVNQLQTTTWAPSTPSGASVFTIWSNFANQSIIPQALTTTPSASQTSSTQAGISQIIQPANIATVAGATGGAVTLTASAGANFGGLQFPITATCYTSSGASTVYTTTGPFTITESSAPTVWPTNSLVGRVVVSGTVANVITYNNAGTGAQNVIGLAGQWFTATTGVGGSAPAANAVYTISGNNVVQVVSSSGPYFHSFAPASGVLPSYTIEKSLGGGDTLHNAQSEQFVGCRIGKYNLKLGATNTEAQFTADVTARNGVSLARTFYDGVLNGTTTFTSATQGAFTSGDIGHYIVAAGIPLGTTITAVASGTSLTMSNAATVSATSVQTSITIIPTVPSYTNENPFVFAEATLTLFGNTTTGGVPGTILQCQDVEIDIDNGLKQTFTLDQSHVLTYNTPVVRTITGKCTVVHDNLDDANFGWFSSLLQYNNNTVQGPMTLTLVHPASGAFLPGSSANQQVQIYLSAVNLSKYSDSVKLEDVIMTSLEFTGFINLGLNPPSSMQAVIANTQAFAY